MANMIVSGAGSTVVNGTYAENGTYDGRPYYEYDNCSIMWNFNQWEIRYGTALYYFSRSNVSTPDLCTNWAPVYGVSDPPTPTVTKEEEQPTGIPKQFLHYARMRGN